MTDEQLLRFKELETKAKDEFFSYSDFSVTDYLDTEQEKEEYNKLFNLFLDEVN